MSAPTRPRNPRGTGKRLQTEVVSAAISLIDETNDPTSLTLRGIARRAGISAPSIYRQFADLDAIVATLLARSFEELTQTMTDAAEATQTPEAALVASCRAYVVFGWEHRARYRLMFAASGYAEDAVAAFQFIEETIASAVKAGTSHCTNPRVDTFLLWTAMHGLATLEKPAQADYLRLGPIDRPAMLDELVHRLARLGK